MTTEISKEAAVKILTLLAKNVGEAQFSESEQRYYQQAVYINYSDFELYTQVRRNVGLYWKVGYFVYEAGMCQDGLDKLKLRYIFVPTSVTKKMFLEVLEF